MNIQIMHRCHCTWAAEDSARTLNPVHDCRYCGGSGEMATTILGVYSYEVSESFEK